MLLALVSALAMSAPALAETPVAVRAIAVGPKLDVGAAESLETFRSEIERLMTKAHREFASDRPNLVVFGGSWDRLTLLLGPEHRTARSAATREEAYEALRQAHAWEFLWTKATHWGLSDRRALWLTLGDRLYRPFVTTFAAAARRHRAYVLACTVAPDVDGLKPFQSMRTFPDRPVRVMGRDVFRKAFLFDPDGRLVGEVKQVALGGEDTDLTPGPRAYVHPFDLPFGKVGIVPGEDARDPALLADLDEQGCRILLQPSDQSGAWAESTSSGDWHPKEWLDTTLGVLQASQSQHVQYTVTPMPSGLYYDTLFDGQSAIMARGDRPPSRLFVGVDSLEGEPFAEHRYHGEVLALSPWVVEDPKFVHDSAGPATSLTDRREYLRKVAHNLQRGGNRENQFVESIATADLAVR
ncbi:MAG TPA: hypothetical protein V6D05_16055 [Stenomitos sp.]